MTVPELIDRLRGLAAARRRILVGIAGVPGAGKSTLARSLADRLGPDAALIGMDGFHLAQRELERLRRADRKGAPDTFDVEGFVALLRRIREQDDTTVYAPDFRREIEEPIANAVPIEPGVPIVIVEGNYLLLDQPRWRDVRTLLDETWFLDVSSDERRDRLIRRRMDLGASEDEARRWTFGSDEHNAQLVEPTRARADLVLAGLSG